MTLSNNSEKSLTHLKVIKPYDGWSIETYTNSAGKELYMLKRRNVPLYKMGFEDIAYDEAGSKCVVGITSYIGETENSSSCRGVVLVDKNGTVTREQDKEGQVRITLKKDNGHGKVDKAKKEKELNQMRQEMKNNLKNARESVRNRSSNNYGRVQTNPNITNVPTLSDEQTAQMAKLGLIFIGVVTVMRIMYAFMFLGCLMPIVVLYAMSDCPTEETFDAKKEMKRVLRGKHLPENHPDKPADNWLSNTITRVTASITAEVATSLGYEISFFSISGICKLATVTVPSLSQELYWVGIFGQWRYVLSRDLKETKSHQD
mmetsp:Transcript_26037/g.30239  ORF Transcript_26037/g.30239 Transcript_26037/m.30239 type:complete len:317 (-) Transcript_26037:1745-2695(-)